LSTRSCPHAGWIAQPSRNRYLFHCRSCNIVISYDITMGAWRISHDPSEEGSMGEEERQCAFESLDRWISEREEVYGHPIFSHPNRRAR